ncbi:hypothetical protein SUGI_1076860 [Cryptomeria japonica]|nr:hypothetical protein SUGI_1076860 [Cryptomeria japonica]
MTFYCLSWFSFFSVEELVPRSTVGWVTGGSHNDGEFPPLVAATSSAGVVAALSATLGDFAAAEGLPTALGTNVGGLDAKIPIGGFVPPKPGVSDPVLDLDTLATVVGASDGLPAGETAMPRPFAGMHSFARVAKSTA